MGKSHFSMSHPDARYISEEISPYNNIYSGVWGYPVWPELPAYSPETVLQPDQDDKYQDAECQGGRNYQ